MAGVNHSGQAFHEIPVYVRSMNGNVGVAKRQCTKNYKLMPIYSELRDLLGLGFGQIVPPGMWVELWLGISYDEIIRMKHSREPWITHYWPLIDKRFSRRNCLEWFSAHFPGRVLPRSACIGCPYHTDAEWSDMKESDPESWEDAVYVDAALRRAESARRFDGQVYLHKQMVPLSEVTFMSSAEQSSLFGEECEGMCGV